MTRPKIPKNGGSVKPRKGSNSAKKTKKAAPAAKVRSKTTKKSRSEAAEKGWRMRRRKAQAKLEGPARIRKGIKDTLEKGARLLAKDKKVFAGMSRHTDAEGFVVITDPGRKLSKKEASVKGWQTRRQKQFQAKGVSFLGSRDWAELSRDRADALERLTQDVLGAAMWRTGERRVNFVRAGLSSSDKRFVLYMTLAREMGYTIRQARTALFSPRAKPVIPPAWSG